MLRDRNLTAKPLLLAWFVLLLFAGAVPARVFAQAPAFKLYGSDFSPYVDGQDPNFGPQITTTQIRQRLQIIAPYTQWVRSFSSTHGLENIPVVAKSFGLKVAAGAWLGRDLTQNALEISGLIASAQAGTVDLAIVGSEDLLRGDLGDAQLIAYIQQVRQAIPAGIPVATADTFDVLLAHPAVLAAGDVVLPNVYPYWQGLSLSNAICALDTAYNQLVAASGGRPIIISETGWPSDGNAVGAAVPSPDNASSYFIQFVSWALTRSVPYFYFEALDETWKAAYEGSQGAHWGVWDTNGVLKPGMQAVFDGQTVAVSCNGIPGGPGVPDLHFTYVPPYGSFDQIEGEALHVLPSDYKVVLYVFVVGSWWVKPTFAMPLTSIQQDGTWLASIVTGGVDQLATQVAAFLIPISYSPPLSPGATLPPELYANAVASALVSRSANSLSGQVTDPLGHPIAGVLISDDGTDSGSTTTAPDGKYSFPNLSGTGPDTMIASAPNYVFNPASQTFAIVSGNVTANWTGTQTADLSVTQTVSASSVAVGSPFTQTVVVANAGPAVSSNAVAVITLPSAFAVTSISTTVGSCTAMTPIICTLGSLARTAYAVITVVATPRVVGTFSVSASVSGPEPDGNLLNNTQSLTILSFLQPPPTATVIAPIFGLITGGTPVAITGTGFVPGATVALGGAAATSVTVVNATTITATTGARAAGLVDVVVTNPDMQTGSLPNGFTYGAAARAQLTTPLSGSTLTGSTVIFQWTSGFGVTDYRLSVGATVGGADLFNRDEGTSLSAFATGLPTTGSPVYVRLWSEIAGVWLFNDYGYIESSPHVHSIAPGDFQGDGKTDLTVFRPSTGTWYIWDPSTGTTTGFQWGNGLDVPVPGDYDGDGKTDIAVFRPSNGTWYIVYSSTGSAVGYQWGNALDVPVPGDYDGDGRTDIAVFRPSTGTWYIVYSSTKSAVGYQWGNGLDVPVPGDYDGDGNTDIAVFRPSTGTWYIVYSSTSSAVGYQWGNGLDVPVPGDYDGDGNTDIAVFRPSTGTWYIVYSGTESAAGFQWGNGNDVPVPGDYNGDGKTDLAVFRPSNGTWYIWEPSTGATAGFQWGNGNDVPVPGDYSGDGKTDLAVFRPSNGTWYIWEPSTGTTTGFQWGNRNDIPVLKGL